MKKSRIVRRTKPLRNAVYVVLSMSFLGLLYWASRGEKPRVESGTPAESLQGKASKMSNESNVPPYFETADAARPFPSLVPAAYYRSTPLAAKAYQIASEIPDVLAQQPCYCYCDRYGHKSLLDCYTSDHAAG
jgi:hypothetical protein